MNAVFVGSRESLARHEVSVGHRPPVRPRRARGGEAPLPLARNRRRPSLPLARGFRLTLDEPAYGVAVGQAAVLYEDDAVVGAGLISASR